MGYHIPDFNNCRLSRFNYSFYAITIRDPFMRTLSAFTYEHPLNFPYLEPKSMGKLKEERDMWIDCFPTLEAFSMFLDNNVTNDKCCSKLARILITGGRSFVCDDVNFTTSSHLSWNLMSILKLFPQIKKSSILVIRNEHLWHDWTTANK